jgi:predicted ATPase
VNVAASLSQSARPGDILLGDTTYNFVRDNVEVQPAIPLPLKGRSRPGLAYPLKRWIEPLPYQQQTFRTSFIGRTVELAQLKADLADATAGRHSRLTTIVGEPGIGKTRLIDEFVASLSDVEVVGSHCLPYGSGIDYLPLIDMIRQGLGLERADDDYDIYVRSSSILESREDAATLWDVAIGNAVEKQNLFTAASRLFGAIARKRPLVAIFDDLHWAQPPLTELILHLAEHLRDAPLMLCCVARPEFLESHPRWTDPGPSARTIVLQRLTDDEIRVLALHLLGAEISQDMGRRVAWTAGGNPLFAEELIRGLMDGGALAQDESGWHLKSGSGRVGIPPSIRALVGARLDRLSPNERLIIESAAVAGPTFSAGMVAVLAPPELSNVVGESLDGLLRRGLVVPVEAREPLAEFRFAHVLVQEAAYNAIPKTVRVELHERLADWLESRLAPEVAASHPEQVNRLRRELQLPEQSPEI